ncbi:MAG: hypothetical protein KF799_12905 [Bdellovibrionales bacterium]|nr:hypothetical protein [Bdellovibrionales bacterium]
MTAVIFVGSAFYFLQKKSVAQSLCVQTAVRLQTALGESMASLMQLNPRAAALRRERARAERALRLALRSGNPKAIAAAKALRYAVILAQYSHRARQLTILRRAGLQRSQATRELTFRSRKVRQSGLISQSFYSEALAVHPVPENSLTPSYVKAQPFANLQRHRFAFQVDLKPPFFPVDWSLNGFRQNSECIVTLSQENTTWNARILAASAASS